MFSEVDNPMIIAGDFNLHNSLWSSSHNDASNSPIVEAMDHNNLIILNTKESTRIQRCRTNKSVVYTSICLLDVANKMN